MDIELLNHTISIWFKITRQTQNNMANGRTFWPVWLWLRDAVLALLHPGPILSLNSWASSGYTHRAHQITEQWGVKNSHVWLCKRNFHTVCVFHELSHPAFSLTEQKPPNAFISFSLMELPSNRLTDSLGARLLESRRLVHYSNCNSALRQRGDGSGISYFAEASPLLEGTFPHLEHICQSVNTQSTFCLSYSPTGEQEVTFTWQNGVRQIINLPCFQPFSAQLKQCATINRSEGNGERAVHGLKDSVVVKVCMLL